MYPEAFVTRDYSGAGKGFLVFLRLYLLGKKSYSSVGLVDPFRKRHHL
jgi:hypothetical protein